VSSGPRRNFDAAGDSASGFQLWTFGADEYRRCSAICFNRVGLHVVPQNVRAMITASGQSLLSNCSVNEEYPKAASTVPRLFCRPALHFCFHTAAA
jgi:hypothetical protein